MLSPLRPHAVTSLWADDGAVALRSRLGLRVSPGALRGRRCTEENSGGSALPSGPQMPECLQPMETPEMEPGLMGVRGRTLSAACHHLPAFSASRRDQEPKVPPAHTGPTPTFPSLCVWAQRKVSSKCAVGAQAGHLSPRPHASGL